MSSIKKTIDDCKKLAESKNGCCLSIDYKNNYSKLEWQCEYNHIWKSSFSNIQQGKWCPVCANKNKGKYSKLAIEDCQKLSESKNGKCLSIEYINAHELLEWECKKGHTWLACFNNVQQGQWCPTCSGKLKKTIEDCKKLAESKGGKCLSIEIKNAHEKLLWECKKGHKWRATYNKIQSDRWCPYCAGLIKKTIDDCFILAKSKKGKCLSNIYKNANSLLEWQCEKGHKWAATYGSIQSGTWCPICNESKGEKKIRNWLNKKNIIYKREKKFEDCRNIYKLPFDFYLPDFNLCIEFDGQQHYREDSFFGKKENLDQIQKRDQIKTSFCLKNNIHLLRIPYWEFNNIEKILESKIKEIFE